MSHSVELNYKKFQSGELTSCMRCSIANVNQLPGYLFYKLFIYMKSKGKHGLKWSNFLNNIQ